MGSPWTASFLLQPDLTTGTVVAMRIWDGDVVMGSAVIVLDVVITRHLLATGNGEWALEDWGSVGTTATAMASVRSRAEGLVSSSFLCWIFLKRG